MQLPPTIDAFDIETDLGADNSEIGLENSWIDRAWCNPGLHFASRRMNLPILAQEFAFPIDEHG